MAEEGNYSGNKIRQSGKHFALSTPSRHESILVRALALAILFLCGLSPLAAQGFGQGIVISAAKAMGREVFVQGMGPEIFVQGMGRGIVRQGMGRGIVRQGIMCPPTNMPGQQRGWVRNMVIVMDTDTGDLDWLAKSPPFNSGSGDRWEIPLPPPSSDSVRPDFDGPLGWLPPIERGELGILINTRRFIPELTGELPIGFTPSLRIGSMGGGWRVTHPSFGPSGLLLSILIDNPNDEDSCSLDLVPLVGYVIDSNDVCDDEEDKDSSSVALP